MGYKVQSPEYYKNFLLSIYKCKQPFELQISTRKTKKRMGTYFHHPPKIIIYSKLSSNLPLEKIAIHEYAHHIHNTEKRGVIGIGRARSHGEHFWRIYSALMAKAIEKGLFNDELINDIIIN